MLQFIRNRLFAPATAAAGYILTQPSHRIAESDGFVVIDQTPVRISNEIRNGNNVPSRLITTDYFPDETVLLDQLIRNITDSPVSANEVDIALNTISDNDGCDNIAPGVKLSAYEKKSLLEGARNILLSLGKKIEGEEINTDESNVENNPEQSWWSALPTHLICPICLDLLAAPHLTNCGHSFCGVCLEDYLSNCTSREVQVIHQCPCCRKEINATTYERSLDDEINRLVGAAVECPQKAEWKLKNELYNQRQRQGVCQEEDSWWWIKFVGAIVMAALVLIMSKRR